MGWSNFIKSTKDNNLLCFLAFLYLPLGVLLVSSLFSWVSGEHQYWPTTWVGVAIVISVIASSFVVLMHWNLRLRAIIVVLLGIASVVVLLPAKISHNYVIAALGFPLAAGAITLVRGKLEENIEPHKVDEFAFKLIPPMALAGGAFIIAMSVSGWNWWNNLIRFASSPSCNALGSYNAAASLNDTADKAALGFFVIGLYYFLGIGLMVLEVTQAKDSSPGNGNGV
jgi:hypothetical protein